MWSVTAVFVPWLLHLLQQPACLHIIHVHVPKAQGLPSLFECGFVIVSLHASCCCTCGWCFCSNYMSSSWCAFVCCRECVHVCVRFFRLVACTPQSHAECRILAGISSTGCCCEGRVSAEYDSSSSSSGSTTPSFLAGAV